MTAFDQHGFDASRVVPVLRDGAFTAAAAAGSFPPPGGRPGGHAGQLR